MKINIDKLNYFVISESQVIFSLSANNENLIYFGNNDKSTSLLPQSLTNTLCFKDSNDILYNNLYNSEDVFYKSAIYNKGKKDRTDTTYDYQNVINHKLSSNLKNVVQVNNIIYALENQTSYGHYDLSCDIYSWISADNKEILPECSKIKTVIYNTDYIQENIGLSIDSGKAILSSYDTLDYNMIYEIPGTVQNDYQSGNIVANTFKAKNQYNSLYNMQHDRATNKIFMGCRQYINIDKCGNQIYLKYYDRYNYEKSGSQLIKKDLSCNSDLTKNQNIESIESVNRYSKLNGHKSNMYSLLIKTNLLNNFENSQLGEVEKERIRQNISKEIANISRKIAESIQPAQTQLLSVYIKEII